MLSRDDWEQEDALRLIEEIRQRRRVLEEFAASLPALVDAARTDESRAELRSLADRLGRLLSEFHMNKLEEMEKLKADIEKLAQG